MSPRRKISTEARLDAVAALVRLRPRLSIVKAAELVDGAASLLSMGQPTKVAEAMFSSVRLDQKELAEVLWPLTERPVSNAVQAEESPHRLVPEGS